MNQKQTINQAVQVLQQGGVIAYPTEAVYGLGCDPENIAAVKKILALKKRARDKGLILVAANLEQLKPYIERLDKNIEKKILESWNNSATAVTWLIPAKASTSVFLKGNFDTLAVRVSHHPVVKELCEAFDGAIVSTSANISTQEAARNSEQVKTIFGNSVDLIVAGETDRQAQPSEIIDALTNKIIRTAN